MKLPGKGMSWREFLKDLRLEWSHDNLSTIASAVTFSAVLSLFPFLLFVVAVVSRFIDPAREASIIDQLSRLAPAAAVQLLSDWIRSLAGRQHTGLASLSIVASLWAASGAIATLMGALNTVHGVTETRPFWKTRGIALAMTLCAALLSIVASVALLAAPALAGKLGAPLGTVVVWLRLPLAALIMIFLWAILYYALPDVEQRFRFLTPGSVTGVLLWVAASYGFSEYVAHFNSYEATYGALGGVVILLVWMWISAQVVLAGAEINAILEPRSAGGKRAEARLTSEAGEDLTRSQKPQAPPDDVLTAREPTPNLRPPMSRARVAAEAVGAAALLWALLRRPRTTG